MYSLSENSSNFLLELSTSLNWMQMREASRRAIGRFDGRRAALNSEDEVDSEASHAAGFCMLWFYGKGGGRRQNHNKAGPSCLLPCDSSPPPLPQPTKPHHTGSRSVACLAIERRPSNRPISRQNASRICIYQSNDVESSSKKLLEFWDRLYAVGFVWF